MKLRALILVALLVGCGRDKEAATYADSDAATADAGPPDADASDSLEAASPDAGVDASDAPAFTLPASCAGSPTPPTSLVCTGLYADVATKTLAPGVEAYTPAVPLWSDGASKQRWISLPAGTTIDNANPDEWIFPVGTKVWKEFSKDGKRVETRLWQKVSATFWVNATFAWNADESAATRSDGGDIPWGTGTYHIPTNDECQKCHRGRNDHILGFEQTLLGLAGAQGMTLGRLVAEGRLTHPPASTTLVIGDDGTALAAPALAWMHVNCGTTCHNRNSNATAWSTGMFLRLDPTQLDGRSVKGFDTLTTTIGVAETSPNWPGRTRIIAHDPAHSLLYQLISHRGTGNQMPPIATSVVDEADIPLVAAWIEQLAPTAMDAGRDAVDAGAEASAGDAPSSDVAGAGAGGAGGGAAGAGGAGGGAAGTGGAAGGAAGTGGGAGGAPDAGAPDAPDASAADAPADTASGTPDADISDDAGAADAPAADAPAADADDADAPAGPVSASRAGAPGARYRAIVRGGAFSGVSRVGRSTPLALRSKARIAQY
jgi:hypothetical protein